MTVPFPPSRRSSPTARRASACIPYRVTDFAAYGSHVAVFFRNSFGNVVLEAKPIRGGDGTALHFSQMEGRHICNLRLTEQTGFGTRICIPNEALSVKDIRVLPPCLVRSCPRYLSSTSPSWFSITTELYLCLFHQRCYLEQNGNLVDIL